LLGLLIGQQVAYHFNGLSDAGGGALYFQGEVDFCGGGCQSGHVLGFVGSGGADDFVVCVTLHGLHGAAGVGVVHSDWRGLHFVDHVYHRGGAALLW
jgi:hypothetical protein